MQLPWLVASHRNTPGYRPVPGAVLRTESEISRGAPDTGNTDMSESRPVAEAI